MPKTAADTLKAAGLNASRTNLLKMEPEDLTLIRDPKHPLYDPRVDWPVERDSALYKDILAKGVEKPIEVRKNGVDKNERPILQVIDGRQRVQILMDINKQDKSGVVRKLPVIFVIGDDKDMSLRMLSSNLLRREETAYSKAVKMQKAQQLGCSANEIAAACNLKSTVLVEQYLQVLSFIPEVQKAFDGQLSASAIAVFAKVPREEQKDLLTTVLEGGGKGKRDVQKAREAKAEGKAFKATVTPKMWRRPKVEELQSNIKKLLKGKLEGAEGKLTKAETEKLEFALSVIDVILDETALEATDVLNLAIPHVAEAEGEDEK